MKTKTKIIKVDLKNITAYPPTCFLNPQNEGFLAKVDWLKKSFREGLEIKLLYLEGEKKPQGFIEYVPGKLAWRAVDAKGYLFIHCIWIYGKTNQKKGYGSLLVKEVINQAKKQNKLRVATITSTGPFMANKALFIKNGFKAVSENKPYSLLVKQLKKGALPKFKDFKKQLEKYQGLNLLYSNQCPWAARFVKDLPPLVKKEGIKIKITKFKTARQAQNAPSIYAVFNLVYNGRLLVDHYISQRRFLNILKREVKK